MHITDALIERFFRGECSVHERQAVINYLIENPDVLRPYLTDKKWSSFKSNDVLPAFVSDRMLKTIESQTYRKVKVGKITVRWAIAAAVLLVSIGCFWLLRTPGSPQAIARHVERSRQPQKPNYQNRVNHTKDLMTLHLNDGSVIQLSPSSEIRYTEPFSVDRRDIYLTGQALFRVAKDKTRPFNVYARGLRTTALGTVFKITAYNDAGKTINVHLIRGKVVVVPDSLLKSKGLKETYLVPGQQLNFNENAFTVSVRQVNKANSKNTSQLAASKKTNKEVLSFTNESLVQVFETLGKSYNVKFIYNTEMLNGMDFTGVFNSNKESLEAFLNTVGTLNGFTIRRENNIIYITQ